MRILFLTPDFPYPPDSGGRIKTLSIIDYLRASHALRILCFKRAPLSDRQSAWAAALGNVDSTQLRRGRNIARLIGSYRAGVPLSIERNRSPAMKSLVVSNMHETYFDAIFVDGWLMAQYLPDGFQGMKLLHEHNAEHVLWDRQAAAERHPLRRLLVDGEARRVRAYERNLMRRFDSVFAVSNADIEALAQLGTPRKKLKLLPNIPDASLLQRPALTFESSGLTVLYFGTLSWQPNIQAAESLLTHVFPLIRARLPQAGLLLAGSGAPASLRRVTSRISGVHYEAEVGDDEPLYRRSRVLVEATRSGGGTKLKILNAMARGLPVISTPEGAQGIEAADGEHILVRNDTESLAEATLCLLTEPEAWRGLSERGRALIRERYLAEKAFAPLDEVLRGDRRPG